MKQSFVKKTLVLFLILCILPFFISVAIFVNTAQKAELHQVNESLDMIITEKAEALNKDIENTENTTYYLARWAEYAAEMDVDTIEFEKKYSLNEQGVLGSSSKISSCFLPANISLSEPIINEALQTEILVPAMKDIIDQEQGITCTYVVTSNGFMRVYPYLDNSIFDKNHDQRNDSFYTVVSSSNNSKKEVKWTQPYIDYAGNGWIITCSCSYYVDGKLAGVVCTDLELENITQSIMDFRIGNSGFAFLITKEGEVLYDPSMSQLNEKMGTVYQKLYSESGENKMVRENILQEMQSKENGRTDFTEDGTEKVIAFQEIQPIDWIVGVEINRDDYVMGKGYLTIGIWSVLIILLILTLMLGVFLSRRITRPILNLTDGVRKMSDGQFHQISIDSQDEIGMLGEAFNKMSTEIETYTQSLVYNKNQLESVFSSIRDTIMLLNKNYYIMKENFDDGNSENSLCYSALHGQTKPCRNCPVKTVIEKKKEQKAEIVSNSRIYQIVAYPVIDDDENFQELVILEKDITETKLLEKELFQTEKMAGVGQMVAGVTHELKNPLTVIKGASYLLKEKNTPEEQNEILQEIDNNIIRAENIVYNMLNFSRPTSSDRERIHIKSQYEQILMLVRQDCVGRKIVVNLDIDNSLFIWGNADSFKHIFLNLITNAIEAMPEGGTLDIIAEPEANNIVKICIKNTGEPIPADISEHMFEPFYSTKNEGTGLGLWIVAKEVKRNDGSIEIENTPHGASFIIRFPSEEGGIKDVEDFNDR